MALDHIAYVKIEVGELQTNTYLLHSKASRTCVIIDPGAEADKIVRAVETLKVKPAGILLTHGHFDHFGAVHILKAQYQIPLWIHEQDQKILGSEVNQELGQMYGFSLPPPADYLVSDGEHITVNDISLMAIHTPGHTPGSIVFHIDSWLFSGDTLFHGDIGRTDLPGGDVEAMKESLKKIMALPEDTLILPGHGETTTIAEEKQFNPYL